MIKVNIKSNHIVITGHANFADYVKDIVCASVSSIVITRLVRAFNARTHVADEFLADAAVVHFGKMVVPHVYDCLLYTSNVPRSPNILLLIPPDTDHMGEMIACPWGVFPFQ